MLHRPFQRFIDTVLPRRHLVAFQDEKKHREHLEQLFARLDQYGVVVNPTKCVFAQTKVKFLGYTVNENGTKLLPEKVKAIFNFPRPDTVKQLRRFLGILKFY